MLAGLREYFQIVDNVKDNLRRFASGLGYDKVDLVEDIVALKKSLSDVYARIGNTAPEQTRRTLHEAKSLFDAIIYEHGDDFEELCTSTIERIQEFQMRLRVETEMLHTRVVSVLTDREIDDQVFGG